MLRSILCIALCILSAPSLLSAQISSEPLNLQEDGHVAVESWLSTAGPNWHVRWNYDRGTVRHLFGGGMATDVDGSTRSFEIAARQIVDDLAPALGFNSTSLRLDQVKPLLLSRVGSSDKVVVKFTQEIDGIAVHRGYVNLLFSMDGKLLSIDNQGLPTDASFSLAPAVSLAEATRVATAHFQQVTGMPVETLTFEDYIVFPAKPFAGKSAEAAAPAYSFTLAAPHNSHSSTLPVIRQVVASATEPAQVFDSWTLVHEFDLTGTVEGWGQGGLLPDNQAPEILQAMKDVHMTAPGEPNNIYTDDNGNFTFSGTNTTKTVTAQLAGQYSRVNNEAGGEASVSLSVSPGSPATFEFNPNQNEQQTAQVNAHINVNRMRDWVKAMDPTDTHFDFQVLSNVNINSTCNAFYNGTSINFYQNGGGCVNTAYSTVVWHEEGHWANDLYNSGNGSDGFGEGSADVWAMYIGDDPLVGAGFCGVGCEVRSGENNTQFCGDNNPGCHGGVHADGEVLMGALWKVRKELKASLGNAAGSAVADNIFLAWYQAYNDSQIKTIVEEHWLALDDDDGNINNGTPHYPAIDAGFMAQGFPGFELPLFSIEHTPIGSVNHEGSVSVTADVVPNLATPDEVFVHYSTDGGSNYTAVAMTPQSGNAWAGTLPGQVSPATVYYYLEAQDAANNSIFLPKGSAFKYDIGELSVAYAFDFETSGDQGWTHVELATQDDWQHGAPQGSSGDPSSAYSGTQIWANDLGNSGWNGAYQPNVHNRLSSPAFNLTGYSNVRLRFQRWLGVEEGIFDQAELFVNSQRIFVNPANGNLIDTAWTPMDYDISALADNNPSVQLRFEMTSDGGVEFGGWNIDDLELVSLGPVSSPFIMYGTGTPGAGGLTPSFSGSGDPTPAGNISLALTDALPLSPAVFLIGTSSASVPGLGGTVLVGNFIQYLVFSTNGSGGATLAGQLPNDPNTIGIQLNMQAWILDSAGPSGKSGSNGLEFTIH